MHLNLINSLVNFALRGETNNKKINVPQGVVRYPSETACLIGAISAAIAVFKSLDSQIENAGFVIFPNFVTRNISKNGKNYLKTSFVLSNSSIDRRIYVNFFIFDNALSVSINENKEEVWKSSFVGVDKIGSVAWEIEKQLFGMLAQPEKSSF